MELIYALAISIGINLLMFIPAFLLKTDKLTDISYALSFVILALYALIMNGTSLASVVLFIMILIWAIRIGSYLLIRIHKIKKDTRFNEMRKSFLKFGGFWLIQGFTVWAVLIPSILFIQNQAQEIGVLAIFGILIWLLGLAIETIADLQKYRFKNKTENKGKWIETGLWKYSRHPNYFGEILLWFGVYIFTFTSLVGLEKWIGLIGPLYIAALIIFLSGIPLLEKKAEKRWGDNKKYQSYKDRTHVLFILPNKNK
ncbi:MAG: steroid 5-alpha reductase family enzyme [Oceanicoccus sp.]|jgi:steroid 5-alpha reductase family enzyme